MVGAIFISPTDATSQEAAVVGSTQRVVVARARARRDATVQNCLDYLGSKHPDFELEGSVRSVVLFEGVLTEAAPCVAYAPVDLYGQVGIAIDILPEIYKLSFVWLYTWPATCTLNMAVDSGTPFVRKHTISILAQTFVRLVVHLASYLYAKYGCGLRHPLRA